MSRVDNIAKFAQRREEAKRTQENAKQERIEAYKEQIRALKPRIDELLEVGNACKKHGIALDDNSWGSHEGYDTHQFISNSWSHLVGFIDEGKNVPFTKVGKVGGGACNWNLTTDGVIIIVDGDVECVLKRFVEGFDIFEAEFYAYVDRTVK